MSYEFHFAEVPLRADGLISDLPRTESGDLAVAVLDCPEVCFNLAAMQAARDATTALGPLLGQGNQSVNLLAPRRALVDRLRRDSAGCEDIVVQTKLELMARNCELAIERFGLRAAVIVF